MLDRAVRVPILKAVSNSRATAVLTVTLLFVVGLIGCKKPEDEGRVLGEQHAELVRKDALTYARMVADLEAHEQKYPSSADRSAFERGYEEGIEPVQGHLAAVVVAHQSKVAGAALADGLEDLGQGLGHMVRGFAEAVSERPDGVADAPVDSEQMKRMGQDVGAFLRALAEGSESFMRGIEEELEHLDAPLAEAQPKAP